MTRIFRIIFVLLGTLALSAPALAAANWPNSLNQYILQVRKTVKTTDMAGYLAVVKNPDGALLIDVREPAEYQAGHVPGAISMPRGTLEFSIWKQLGYPNKIDMNKKIYVQCLTGGRATLAAKQLQDIGFTNVTAVIMDLREWAKKGYPLVR